MKTLLRFFFKTLLFTMLGWSVAFAQTTRIADNNTNAPTGANIYTTIQAAVDAAVPGDIVYITPSLTNYGSVTISKRVKLIGVGFNTPELGGRTSSISSITLLSSADGVNSVSNSEFRGFNFLDFTFTAGGVGVLPYNDILIEKIAGRFINYSGAHNPINNLTIRNCGLNAIHVNQTNSNTRIYQNVITLITFCCSAADGIFNNNGTNLLISNNLIYFTANSQNVFPLNLTNSTNARIEHNLISGNGVIFRNLLNTPVTNNIFYGVNPATNSGSNAFQNNVFSNNLITPAFTIPPPANAGGTNSGLGNIPDVSALFVNGPASATTWAATYDYTLQAGSVCINGATTGDNIGPSGGLYPLGANVVFKASAIPLITLFNNSGVVPQNAPLKSSIKAKSN